MHVVQVLEKHFMSNERSWFTTELVANQKQKYPDGLDLNHSFDGGRWTSRGVSDVILFVVAEPVSGV